MKYLIIPFLLILTACTSITPKPVIIHPDRIEPVTIESPEWKVYNQSGLSQLSTDQTKKDQIWYVIDDNQFRHLMKGMIQIGDKLQKQDLTIEYYRQAVDKFVDNK